MTRSWVDHIAVALAIVVVAFVIFVMWGSGSERHGPSTEPAPKQITICTTEGDCDPNS